MSGGSLPGVNMRYVSERLPHMHAVADRYIIARARFMAARDADEPCDQLRRDAESLRDQLASADRPTAIPKDTQ